jgi:Transposase family tnp2
MTYNGDFHFFLGFLSSFSEGDGNNDIDADCLREQTSMNNHGKTGNAKSPFDKSPLFPGCKSTKLDLALMLIFLMTHHNLSYHCVGDLLTFTDMLLMEGHVVPGSIYHLRLFFTQQYTFLRQYYCTGCEILIKDCKNVCHKCEKKSKNDFVYLPIEKQIEQMFQRKAFRDMIFNRNERKKKVKENIESIADGSIYKHSADFLSNPHHFSLCYYSDGVQIWNSSNKSFWPMYFTFNELPYKERFKIENMIMMGIWYNGKPNFNEFFKPAVADLLALVEKGVEVKYSENDKEVVTNVKGFLLNGHGDSPARSAMLCMKQYNCKFGCLMCFQKAVSNPTGKGVVYLYQLCKSALRTSGAAYYRLATGRKPRGQDHNRGYKGLTILYTVMPKCIESMGVDAMHCLFMGIGKKLLQLWFCFDNRNEKFSLRKFLKLFDSYAAMIKKPNFITRAPRSIEESLSYLTTSELRDFVMYYLTPLLNQINMPKSYLQHYFLLVEAVYLLNQNSISEHDIELAEQLLDTFVRNFAMLYDTRYMSSNIHYLTHLAENVRRFGPLFETSCFPKESLNGQIKSRILGVMKPEMKVMEYICTRQCFPNFIETYFPNKDSNIQKFMDRILSRNRARILKCLSNSVKILGNAYRPARETLAQDDILASAYSASERQRKQNIKLFTRLQIQKTIYCSKMHTQAKSSISYCVEYGADNMVGLIQFFVEERNCECRDMCSCECRYFAVIQKCEKVAIERLGILNPYVNKLSVNLDSYCVVPIEELKGVCVFMDFEDDTYYARKVNDVDLE